MSTSFRATTGANLSVKPEMVWVDLETTGLPENVQDESVLELGIVITDRVGVEFATYRSLVIDPYYSSNMRRAKEVVREMHESSGLLSELDEIRESFAKSGETLWSSRLAPDNVADDALDWLVEMVGPRVESDRLPLCGSTINFDRTFLAHHMRVLHDWFHYRNIDVSTVMNLIKMHRPELYAFGEKAYAGKTKKHRVLDDLRDSISWYRFYLDNFLKVHPAAGMPTIRER
jgi:oligoribonuclease